MPMQRVYLQESARARTKRLKADYQIAKLVDKGLSLKSFAKSRKEDGPAWAVRKKQAQQGKAAHTPYLKHKKGKSKAVVPEEAKKGKHR